MIKKATREGAPLDKPVREVYKERTRVMMLLREHLS